MTTLRRRIEYLSSPWSRLDVRASFRNVIPPGGSSTAMLRRFTQVSGVSRTLTGCGIKGRFSPSDGTPIIVALPGLTGGSYEPYIRAILSPASVDIKNGGLGYRAAVVNCHTGAGVPVTSPRLYTAGHTDDLRQALIYISHMYPGAPLIGLGFSMGAGILVRYLAEEGSASRLVSACALAGPWDLVLNSHLLMNTFFIRNVWARGMGTNWLNLLKRHEKALRKYPDHPISRALPSSLALRYPTLAEFDSTFTRRVGGPEPMFPFKDVDAYYRWASSDTALKDVQVPLLTINSSDDPLVQAVPADGGGSPYVVMARTPKGGHLGWFESGGGRWITGPVLEWIRLTAEDVIHDSESETRASIYISVDTDGFLHEAGKCGLGCKEVEGGGVLDGNRGQKGMFQGL
ncbi:Alpha/Beta hydrolase protein [Mycena sp. CBHHK59/15]|nr:Alpha/Beta hydrolase protein [Mycena sp. CBHHK59/15]